MHFSAGVVVPPGTSWEDAEKLVEEAMAPHREGINEDGWWDWWQIGGRYTGKYSEYDPKADPANTETCYLCEGTGRREDAERFGAGWMEWTGGCNGCMGKGTRIKWATDWATHDGDICPVEFALNTQVPYTALLPDGTAVGIEFATDKEAHYQRVRQALEPYRSQWLVVVDYHS